MKVGMRRRVNDVVDGLSAMFPEQGWLVEQVSALPVSGYPNINARFNKESQNDQ